MLHLTSLKAMKRGLAFYNIAGLVQKFGEETISIRRLQHGLIYVNCAQIKVTLTDWRTLSIFRNM